MNKLTAVILAAGAGTRLGKETKGLPKALVDINGRPLISYAINFLKACGVDRIIVVGGYEYEKLKKVVNELDPTIEVYENPDYERQNLYSLEKVLPKIDESFLIFHVDHLYQKDISEKIQLHFRDNIIIFTFKDRQVKEDETKILIDENGVLKKLSKELTEYNRGDFAMMYASKEKLEEYKKAVELTKKEYGDNAKAVDVMPVMAKDLPIDVYTVDMEGKKMMEVDYPEELEKARKFIKENKNLYL